MRNVTGLHESCEIVRKLRCKFCDQKVSVPSNEAHCIDLGYDSIQMATNFESLIEKFLKNCVDISLFSGKSNIVCDVQASGLWIALHGDVK